MENLQGALTAASRNAQTRAVVAPHLKANLKALAVAKSNLSNLNGAQLEAMQRILGLDPAWADQPNALRQDLSEFSTPQSAATSSSSTPAGYISDCTDTNLGPPRALFYSYWAAAQAASVANAVATAIPTGDEYEAGLIAGGIAYGVTNGLAIGLNDRLARALDCSTAASNATLVSAYPVDPSTSAYTRASSQVSVNTLTDLAGDIDGTLDTIEMVINSTTGELAIVINNLGLAKGNTDAIQATAMDLQTRAHDLLGSLGTPTDQATYSGSDPSGTANGLANTIHTRQDTALASTAVRRNVTVSGWLVASSRGPVVPLHSTRTLSRMIARRVPPVTSTPSRSVTLASPVPTIRSSVQISG
jgi:hypothetical protein